MAAAPTGYVHTIAVHEAGHAVAACAYRIKFDRVVLNPASKPSVGANGIVDPWWNGGLEGTVHPFHRMRAYRELPHGSFVKRSAATCPRFRKRAQDYVVMLLAGREAMEVLLGKSYGYSKDYKDAHKQIKLWLAPGATAQLRRSIIEGLRPRAAALMRTHFGSIVLVARQLDAAGALSSREVREIVFFYKPARARNTELEKR
jgi:hypothetical protein